MEFLAFPLIVAWMVLLLWMTMGAGKRGIYVTRQNLVRAAAVGVLGGVAWALVEPSDTILGALGKVLWIVLATVFLFWQAGDQPPEKVKAREEKWIIDLPDRTLGRLQWLALIGAVLAEFVLGILYALFWEQWSSEARTAWIVGAVVVALMVVIPLLIVWTRRRPRPPGRQHHSST